MKKNFKLRKFQKNGFTFLEVMVSILILAIGVVLLLNIFPISLKNFQKSKDVTMATLLAQTKMEELRSYGADIPAGEFGEYSVPDHSPFTCKVEKIPALDSYDEIKVSVNKPEYKDGQLISSAYAAVSVLAGIRKIADFVSITVGATAYPSVPAGTYHFISDPQNKCIWSCMTEASLSAIVPSWMKLYRYRAGGWIPSCVNDIAYLPNNGVPGKIQVVPNNYIGTTYPPSTMVQARPCFPLYIYVTDTANNCVWKGVINVAYDSYGNFKGLWVKNPSSLPPSPPGTPTWAQEINTLP